MKKADFGTSMSSFYPYSDANPLLISQEGRDAEEIAVNYLGTNDDLFIDLGALPHEQPAGWIRWNH